MRRIACALAVLILAGSSAADDLSRSVTDYTVIQDGSGSARVLFKMQLAEDLGPVAIGRARLRFNVSGTAESRTMRLRAHPITTNWSAGAVSWTGGWSRAGGDFDENLYTLVELDLSGGSTNAELDLTPMLKEALEQGVDYHGVLLTVDPAEGTGLRSDDVSRLQGLRSGSVEVYYRKVTRRPRSR